MENPYIVVVKLSDNGSIKQKVAQMELPYTISGRSDMVFRDSYLYVGSCERLYIFQNDANGLPQLVSSLPAVGCNVAIALHPKAPVLYITNNKGLFVVDVSDPANPILARRLLFAIELRRIWGGEWSDHFAGMDIACEDDTLVIATQDVLPNPANTTLIFDVSKPLEPRAERTLNTPPNTSAVAMGLVDHQLFVGGDDLVEYYSFEPDPIQQERNSSRLRIPYSPQVIVPGSVVEMKFVNRSFGYMEVGSEIITFPIAKWGRSRDYEIDPEKLREIIEKYRHGSPEERQELRNFAPLDDGILYIATEHALTFYDTESKKVFWKRKSSVKFNEKDRSEYNVSDYFENICGMDTRWHNQAYIAAGKDGVYIVDLLWDTEGRFVTRECYKELPGSALDVCIDSDNLYILCGDPAIQDADWKLGYENLDILEAALNQRIATEEYALHSVEDDTLVANMIVRNWRFHWKNDEYEIVESDSFTKDQRRAGPINCYKVLNYIIYSLEKDRFVMELEKVKSPDGEVQFLVRYDRGGVTMDIFNLGQITRRISGGLPVQYGLSNSKLKSLADGANFTYCRFDSDSLFINTFTIKAPKENGIIILNKDRHGIITKMPLNQMEEIIYPSFDGLKLQLCEVDTALSERSES